MNQKPDRVELFENNQLKLILTDSHKGSLNNEKGVHGRVYKGRAERARILGRAGSVVTFYDNRSFKADENSIMIEKLTDDPVEVPLARDFVPTKEKTGGGVFQGEAEGQYKWALMKSVKKDWFDEALDAMNHVVNVDDLLKQAQASGDPRVQIAGRVTAVILDNKRKSNNYRVDNCSSIRFGA